jgi:hypothetical protein
MDVTRFRSFAERYVIERASTFKGDTEMEDAWNAVERAKSIYKHIENVANVEDAKDLKQEHATRSQGMATQGPPESVAGAAMKAWPNTSPGRLSKRSIP